MDNRNVITQINGGTFRSEIFTRAGKDLPLCDITRSYLYKGQMVTQRLGFMLRNLEELEYIVTQLRSEGAKLNGHSLNPDGNTAHATPSGE